MNKFMMVMVTFKGGGYLKYAIDEAAVVEHSNLLHESLKKSRELKTFTGLIDGKTPDGAWAFSYAIEDVSGYVIQVLGADPGDLESKRFAKAQVEFYETQVELTKIHIKKINEGEEWRPGQ